MEIRNGGSGNHIDIGQNVDGALAITGDNNHVSIKGSVSPSALRMHISGSGNKVQIGTMRKSMNLMICVGNHVRADGVEIAIGDNFSSEPGCEFLIYNSGNTLRIGDDCMFSRDIIIRTGESPHLIFDDATGEYLDRSEGVFIGDHVWVGERAYITKRASVQSNSIVAACSVVTKRFSDRNVAIGGSPARIIRRGVRWERNHSHLDKGSPFYESWRAAQKG